MKVTMDSRYRTKDGRDIRILCLDAPGVRPIVGIFEDSTIIKYYIGGRYSSDGISNSLDLVEYHPYDDFVIDEPVRVKNRPDDAWEFRHFAGVTEDHKLLTWIDGGTSWTRTNTVSWKYAERKGS